MSLIKQLQEGEIALEFNIGDQSEDLQKVIKIAFPKDPISPTGSARYYYTTDPYLGERTWVASDNLPNMQIVPISEFLKELNPPEKSIAERLRKGEIAIHMDSRTDETKQLLQKIIRQAFPYYTGKIGGGGTYYCKDKRDNTWDFWESEIMVTDYTIIPITTLLSNKMENKEIIGYRLAKPEYEAAAAGICGYGRKMAKVTDPLYSQYDLNFLLDSDDRRSIEKAGVLNLWFEPVYKEKAPTIKIGDYTGIVDKTVEWFIIEGVSYSKSFIEGLIEALSKKHMHSINVGCNGQIKLTKKELQNILNQM
jgi:hypothetical protein